jgi:hypothetical protein
MYLQKYVYRPRRLQIEIIIRVKLYIFIKIYLHISSYIHSNLEGIWLIQTKIMLNFSISIHLDLFSIDLNSLVNLQVC